MLVAFEWNVLCIYLTYNLTVVHICCFLRKNACLVRIWANWQLRSNQSDVHVRELVMNLCIVYFWYCGTWIGFKFEDDTNCDGEFDYYAIMYLYINWCVNACIYIRFVNFVTIFSPQKSYLQDCLWYIKELFSYLSVWNVLCVECPFIAFLKALLFRFMAVHIIYFSLKCNMYLQCLQNCMLHVLSSFLWNVYVCALINKPFLENWKMQIYLKRFFFLLWLKLRCFIV